MILYFSGTGNCKYVAQRIAEALHDRMISIEEASPLLRLREGEPLGFVTPTHWWELPVLMRAFMQSLTVTSPHEPYTFLVVTYGTTPGCCGEDARHILKKRGIALNAAFSVQMPDSWTPVFDLSDPQKVARLTARAEKSIEWLLPRLRNREMGNHTEGRLPYWTRFVTDIFLNQERKTKHFYVEDTCIGCGLCARRCPVQAIEIKDNKPVWVKDQCALCFRCLHHCPRFAIQYGSGRTKQHGQYVNPHVKV